MVVTCSDSVRGDGQGGTCRWCRMPAGDTGGAGVGPVGEAFPGVVKDGKVDREALREAVLGKPEELKRLNAIVHPLVGRDRVGFFARAEADGADMVVLDIPLLFETGGHANVDAVVVASAPADMQRERVLARPGMTDEKFAQILALQVPDAEKVSRADYVIDLGPGAGRLGGHMVAQGTPLQIDRACQHVRRFTRIGFTRRIHDLLPPTIVNFRTGACDFLRNSLSRPKLVSLTPDQHLGRCRNCLFHFDLRASPTKVLVLRA